MDRNIFHLSGGEKQKVACAGVSIMEPEVLVLDEPSSNLDAASISDLRKTLASGKAKGKPSSYRNTGSIISVVWRIVLFI